MRRAWQTKELTEQLVVALEEFTGSSLDSPLYEEGINVESIKDFFESNPEGGRVTFSYNDVEVTVTNEELVFKPVASA